MATIDDITRVKIADLTPYEKNARVHTSDQVDQIAASIKEFGFLNPILIDKGGNIIAGHGRVMAAERLGMEDVPALYIEGLTEAQRRAYILADNRLTELGGWDDEILNGELQDLFNQGFNIELTGFDLDLHEEKESTPSEELNPTAALPESRVFIFAVSAFGTNAEKFVEIQLRPEEAERLLKRADEMTISEVAAKFREVINAL